VQEVDSKTAYVVTRLFLEKVFERTGYEELIVLVSGMCLSLDGERSMDPAMVHDWTGVVRERNSFTKYDAFAAARAYLDNWYAIGPHDEIKAVIDSMMVGTSGEPVLPETAEIWNRCWETLSENQRSGELFKTAYC
jgi:hypothetical protein